jgi:hypothetical protein
LSVRPVTAKDGTLWGVTPSHGAPSSCPIEIASVTSTFCGQMVSISELCQACLIVISCFKSRFVPDSQHFRVIRGLLLPWSPSLVVALTVTVSPGVNSSLVRLENGIRDLYFPSHLDWAILAATATLSWDNHAIGFSAVCLDSENQKFTRLQRTDETRCVAQQQSIPIEQRDAIRKVSTLRFFEMGSEARKAKQGWAPVYTLIRLIEETNITAGR